VSSYSFRLVQNGFIFFFVLAVAARFLFRSAEEKRPILIPGARLRLACMIGMVPCVLLAAYSVVRVSSVYFSEKANVVENIDHAIPLYETAVWIDDEDPNPHFYLGSRLIASARYNEAAIHLGNAVRKGQGGSPTYSLLATAQFLAGDLEGAEATFSEARKLYPRSTFVLTRYAFFLKQNGKFALSDIELDRARLIDASSSETWWIMINDGAVDASKNASQNKDFDEIMDLVPNAAIYAIKTEREIRFPEEKSFPLGELQRPGQP